MELNLFHVNLVCDHQTVDFLLIIRSGFQIEPDTEHAICRVVAGLIRDDCLPVTDHYTLIVRHVDGVGAGLNLIAHGLTLMELQRENQIGNLAAFAQKFQLRVLYLNVILVARAEVLEGNHRHDNLLQADTAVDIVLTTALNLHADGVLWGVGGLTFGLSMRYLGVALGQSIALGTCAGFGTLFPALFAGKDLLHGEGLMLLIGVCITLAGIAIIGYAGSLRSKNMTEEEKRAAVKDFALTKGLLVALLAGVMSACFALGLDAGTPIKEAALAGGVEALYAGLPVIFLVTLGGFCTNAIYCIWQNIKNKTGKEYFSVKGAVLTNNLLFCALAGVLWYSQFFGLEMGKSFLTDSPILLAFSWSILMSLNVTFSNVWGILLKEWKGVSNTTIAVLILGLVVLISSIIVVAMAQV